MLGFYDFSPVTFDNYNPWWTILFFIIIDNINDQTK